MVYSPPNKDKRLPPTHLQPAEVEALIEACAKTRYTTRNRALITFLYRTGAMVGEALSVRISDVDLVNDTVKLGGELRLAARTLGIDKPMHEALSNWLQERSTLELTHEYLFCAMGARHGVQPSGQALSYEATQHLLERVTRAAGLGTTRVHAQAFRHSFAAELIGEGWPLPYIQRQLGITTFRNIDTLLNNLNLPLPEEDEVMAVVRTRVWDSS